MTPGDVRAVVSQWVSEVKPKRATVKEDLVAGLPGAISSVPDGMAASVLTGVNPVYGLYASGFGPIAGGLTSNTRLMVITTTSAAALAAGSTLSGVDDADRAKALFLLTVLAGVAMILAGAFKLGRYTRFVSHSVMIGFLTGVAVNIILGQIPDLLGVSAEGSTNAGKNRIAQIAMISTFVATLLLPVAAAVGLGLVLSLLLQLNREALDLRVVERVHRSDGLVDERPVRAHLISDTVTELDVYGSLFYAGAQTLRAKLPAPTGAERPVVVLRLRGRSSLGATFVAVIDEYADRLHRAGGRLYLSGVDPDMMKMLERTNQINGSSHVRAFPATATVGEATTAAAEAANTRLITSHGGSHAD